MKTLRAIFRLFLFATYTLLRVTQIVVSGWLLGPSPLRGMRIRQSWGRWLLPRIGVDVQAEGRPPDQPCIVMANHRSYLDPVILVMDILGYPVSKAEVAGWPIVGYGAKMSGVLFLKRENVGSRKRTLAGIGEKVREGFPVILFPEGTTHGHPRCIPLKRGAFALAAEQNIPVTPVMIEYDNPADYWIGNDTFLPHFIRRFGEKKIRVYVRYGPLIPVSDAQQMLDATRDWIDAQLEDLHRQKGLHEKMN